MLNLIAAAMVLEFERGNPDANITSYPDALWWAATTITTVGYGDRFPMSPASLRYVGVLSRDIIPNTRPNTQPVMY